MFQKDFIGSLYVLLLVICMAIFLEHAFHYLCSVLQGEWRACPLNVIYSAGFSYVTTCNLQTTIERPFVLLSYLTLTKFIHRKKCRFFVQRGLQNVGGWFLFNHLEEYTYGNNVL